MRKLIIAALAASALATPALAQDKAPFSGVRVEAIAGWDRNQVSGGRSDGIHYGAGLGYDFRAGGAVLGIEGEAGDSTADKCATGVSNVGDRLCAEAGRDLYVGGRVGALIGPSTLVYAKAGYANTRLRVAYDANLAGTAGDFTTRGDYDGLRVGGGIEHAIGRNTFVKAEYRYSNYEQGFEKHQVVGGFGFRF
ncbi:MAG: outer membrane protein [Allosphingosinicella sp.]